MLPLLYFGLGLLGVGLMWDDKPKRAATDPAVDKPATSVPASAPTAGNPAPKDDTGNTSGES